MFPSINTNPNISVISDQFIKTYTYNQFISSIVDNIYNDLLVEPEPIEPEPIEPETEIEPELESEPLELEPLDQKLNQNQKLKWNLN